MEKSYQVEITPQTGLVYILEKAEEEIGEEFLEVFYVDEMYLGRVFASNENEALKRVTEMYPDAVEKAIASGKIGKYNEWRIETDRNFNPKTCKKEESKSNPGIEFYFQGIKG